MFDYELSLLQKLSESNEKKFRETFKYRLKTSHLFT